MEEEQEKKRRGGRGRKGRGGRKGRRGRGGSGGGRGGGALPSEYSRDVVGQPPELAKARRLQLADASFRDIKMNCLRLWDLMPGLRDMALYRIKMNQQEINGHSKFTFTGPGTVYKQRAIS